MQTGTALAHMLAGSYDHASFWASKAPREFPTFALAAGVRAASDALAGRRREAERTLRDLRQLNPSLRITNISDWVQLRRPADLDALAEGLRRSGLPE
jgi:hypothetical protein